MSIPTDEQIQKWRDRWDKYPGLADQIADILVGDGPPKDKDEVIKRMWSVKRLIESQKDKNDFEDFGVIEKKHKIPILDLRGINWERKIYYGIKVTFSHFEGSKFNEASFDGADFNAAHFERAEFNTANLKEVRFTNSYLELAQFFYAHLEEAIFINARMIFTDLEGATLNGACLNWAKLYQANLKEAICEGTKFYRSKLSGAVFWHTKFGKYKSEKRKNYVDIFYFQDKEKTFFGESSFSRQHITSFYENDVEMKKLWKLLPKSRLKNSYKKITKKQIRNKWFLTDFTGVDVEEADFSGAGDLKRYILDQQFLERFKTNYPGPYWAWNFFTKCGWSWKRLLILSLFTIFLFAGIYGIPYPIPQCYPDWLASLLSNTIGIDPNFSLMNNEQILSHAPDLPRFWQLFYISFDIFTNLGIRTTFPMNGWGVFVMFTETVFGFVALGMLISVLTNRFARRS